MIAGGTYILDTDTLSLYQRGDERIREQVKAHAGQLVAVSVISLEEQLSGWYALLRRLQTPQQLEAAYTSLRDSLLFTATLPVLTFSAPAVRQFDQLRALRLNVGNNDLRIAATALVSGAVVVTRNTRDFGRVPGLTIEDWSL